MFVLVYNFLIDLFDKNDLKLGILLCIIGGVS